MKPPFISLSGVYILCIHVFAWVPVRRHKYWSNCVFQSSMFKVKLFFAAIPMSDFVATFINEELPHQHPLMPSASDLPESIQVKQQGCRKCQVNMHIYLISYILYLISYILNKYIHHTCVYMSTFYARTLDFFWFQVPCWFTAGKVFLDALSRISRFRIPLNTF